MLADTHVHVISSRNHFRRNVIGNFSDGCVASRIHRGGGEGEAVHAAFLVGFGGGAKFQAAEISNRPGAAIGRSAVRTVIIHAAAVPDPYMGRSLGPLGNNDILKIVDIPTLKITRVSRPIVLREGMKSAGGGNGDDNGHRGAVFTVAKLSVNLEGTSGRDSGLVENDRIQKNFLLGRSNGSDAPGDEEQE